MRRRMLVMIMFIAGCGDGGGTPDAVLHYDSPLPGPPDDLTASDDAPPALDMTDTSDSAAVPTCSDGLKNGKETDVDCGGGNNGTNCKACDNGKGCGAPSD